MSPGDPYPTWPFTRLDPKALETWIASNPNKKQWPQADIDETLL